MKIEIRKLTPHLADDYIHFFDTTPHYHEIDDQKCYCVCWSSDDCEGKDFSTKEKRRAIAREYVLGNHIQGYLAYCDDKVVGWCNANTKADCLNCMSWKYFMQSIPTDEIARGVKVKSVFCFTIAPEYKRQGIATRLLEQVCTDAATDGFDLVEVYPNKDYISDAEEFRGPCELYQKCGFVVTSELEHIYIMQKTLKQ